jgi:7-cyano-7-deazaguanine synthase in queuosine biosynthesis
VTAFHLRTTRNQPLPADPATFALDWFSGSHRQRSTIAATTELLSGLAPSPAARDLLHLGGAVYCIDKLALRAETGDAWTRELELNAPVRTRPHWQRARPALTEALTFLSGDRWRLRFRAVDDDVRRETSIPAPDAVCLFSGGLDSLAGAIDLLEDGRNIILVGHFESGFIGGVQTTLAQRLRCNYRGQIRLRQLRLGPAAPNRLQARSLPEAREITTRARSFLFVAVGLAVANAFDENVPLYMPENGFIGINVPFVASRAGSLSTRTTHPYFVERLTSALETVGIMNAILNPFRLKTKGEALAECRNPQLLKSLVDESISCAHPESARWDNLPASNCGYCFPCLIRRAALARIGLDAGASYRHDALTEAELLEEGSDRGADLRALVRGLAREPRSTDVLRNGSVPADDAVAFDGVYRRGRAEFGAWLAAGAAQELREALAAGGPAA